MEPRYIGSLYIGVALYTMVLKLIQIQIQVAANLVQLKLMLQSECAGLII